MSAIRSFQQGVEAVQQGRLDEGARLLRVALDDDTLSGSLRATALMWLAEISKDTKEKIRFYTNALSIDPANELAQQKLAALLRPPANQPSAPPPTPNSPDNPLVKPKPPTPVYQPAGVVLSSPQPQPVSPPPVYQQPLASTLNVPPILAGLTTPQPAFSAAYHLVGIIDGPNGRGSGFFISKDGLAATTRFVVGGRDTVTVELGTQRQIIGRVVRSFPDLDIAFVYTGQPVNDLLPISPFPSLPDNAPITVLTYSGQMVTGRRRETGRALPPHLFPTDIVQVPDAGGGPVFDEHHYLAGMLTRNISSSSAYVYGVYINAIRRCLEQFYNEMRATNQRVYCQSCGYVSQAGGAGAYYCENCGTTLPHAVEVNRFPTPQLAAFYAENNLVTCPHCYARAGFHNGLCLRCGRGEKTTNPAR